MLRIVAGNHAARFYLWNPRGQVALDALVIVRGVDEHKRQPVGHECRRRCAVGFHNLDHVRHAAPLQVGFKCPPHAAVVPRHNRGVLAFERVHRVDFHPLPGPLAGLRQVNHGAAKPNADFCQRVAIIHPRGNLVIELGEVEKTRHT